MHLKTNIDMKKKNSGVLYYFKNMKMLIYLLFICYFVLFLSEVLINFIL